MLPPMIRTNRLSGRRPERLRLPRRFLEDEKASGVQPKTDLHEDRPDKIDTAGCQRLLPRESCNALPAANNRHNACAGFKGLQNMLGLQPPGAWNKYLLNLDGHRKSRAADRAALA